MRRASYLALALFASALQFGCGSSASGGGVGPGFGLPGNTWQSDGSGGLGGLLGNDAVDGAGSATGTDDADVSASDGNVGPIEQDVVGGGADASDDSGGSAADTEADTGPTLSLIDNDVDGYSPADGDCDDNDKTVHPLAEEICDGQDNDCNGKIDELDSDQDGFSSCPGPNADCDDTNPLIFPGAPVDCANGNDNDCDGVIDGSKTGDADNDGFDACQDCNDNDPKVYPKAAKVCDNGKDNDCNGIVDGLEDLDKDGITACSDCDDTDPQTYPLAPEVCNGKDNDCTGVADDLDQDGDGWSGCGGQDCDDTDININPGAGRNCKNGKDNDCSGVIDDLEDGDGDGFPGCKDCDDSDPGQNPNAWEMPADQVDNDCDGQTDEPPTDCDVGNLSDGQADDYVKAIDLCPPAGSTIVKSSSFPVLAANSARAIKTVYGPPNIPNQGKHFAVLSSGNAAAKGQPGYVLPQSGTSFTNTAPYPAVNCSKSGAVNDYTEWKVTLQVPGNVNGFSFQFNFMSAEYPEWVGTQFNDKFLAVLESKKFQGNISFDAKGNCVSINNAFFTVCSGCKSGDGGLAGTGYEGGIGGGTGWLTTTSPVEPGETITLRFIIFDEGDHIYDSVVLLDNFRWEILGNGQTTPSTVRPGG